MTDDQRQKLDLIAQNLSAEAPSLARALSEMHRPMFGFRPESSGPVGGIRGFVLFVSVLSLGVALIGVGSVLELAPLLVAGTVISAFGPLTMLWGMR